MMILQLLLVIGLNIYLPWRLGNLFALEHKAWLYVLFAAGLISGFATMPLVIRFDNVLVNAYYNLTWTWQGAFLYLSCLLVFFEIVNLVHKLPPTKAGWCVIALTAIFSLYALINASSFKVSNISVPIKGLKNEVKIVQISDVHLGAARGRGYLTKIVSATNELKPDFVVITGDLADSKVALSKDMFAPLKDLNSPGYFVYGNHDVYVGLDELTKKLKDNNITVLQNELLAVKGIKLIGLNYMKADDSVYDPHQVTDETIKDTLPGLDLSGKEPKVVLHHGPWGIEYMSEHGIDLVLTGHTHAGQMFPINLIANIFFPYNCGLAKYKETQMYVSQGAGTFLSKMRLGTNNEINFITLVAD